MTSLQVATVVLGLLTAIFGFATAYLNFQATQQLVRARAKEKVKKKLWPWK